MRQVTVSTVISAPREQIFDFVCDLAARPAYTDHFMRDYRLARVNPVGRGRRRALPAARRRSPRSTPSCRSPRSTGRAGSSRRSAVGRRGRNRSLAVYDFIAEGHGVTRVELTTFSEPATVVDRVKELGAAGWMRRQTAKALERLRMIFEEPAAAASSSAPRSPATSPPRRRASASPPGMDPARAPRREAS